MSTESSDGGEQSDDPSLSTFLEHASHEAFEVTGEEAKRFFELSLDLLCIADTQEGYFLRVNPQFQRTLGYTADELTSRPIVEFVHPDDHQKTHELLNQIRRDERTVEQFVNRYICKDGSIVWIEWRSSTYQSGQLTYATGRDITDLKRAERERRHFKQQFEQAQKLESVGVLAGGIAHDFNNLLMTILANTGLIESTLDGEHEVHDWVDAISEAAHRGAELCDQLLAYAGEGQFQVEESDLSTIVRGTNHLLQTAVSEGVELVYELEGELPLAQLDTTQIQQILMNVVQNASEAIEADGGGTITVETGTDTCERSDLLDTYLNDELEPGEYVYLRVEDDGIGMSDDELSQLFDPFYTTKETGRGLGLSATLGIVRAHEGAVEVESEPDEGTTFTFYFPTVETTNPFFTDDDEDSPLVSSNHLDSERS
jgi:PAS domain S-box-containing protein